jgi:hypothetical protein
MKSAAAALLLSNVAAAITETLTTPGLDLTHGKLGTVASAVTFTLTTF